MLRVELWHSRHSKVHHNHPDCYVGRKIQQRRRIDGAGYKPLCAACAQLNKAPR